MWPEISPDLEEEILKQYKKPRSSFKLLSREFNLPPEHIKYIVKKNESYVSIDISAKLELIKNIESNRETVQSVAQKMGVTVRRIRSILKQKDNISDYLSKCGQVKATSKVLSIKRHPVLEIVDNRILSWILEQNRKSSRLSGPMIRERARAYCKELCQSIGIHVQFEASSGWFERFKSRHSLRTYRVCGESGNADQADIDNFVDKLATIISEGNYSFKQIFNVDECGVYWKMLLAYAHSFKDISNTKINNDKRRVTILFGGNADGYKLKPLLIGKQERPKSFLADVTPKNKRRKVYQDQTIPFHYRSQPSVWMNTSIFNQWLETMFIPEVKRYLEQQGLPFKALLLIDNAPVHCKVVVKNFPQVEVVFLPPFTTSLCQPMSQSVIRCWKANYLRILKEEIINTADESEPIEKLMKEFDLYSAIKLMDKAWSEVKTETVANSFNKVLASGADLSEEETPQDDEYLSFLKGRFSPSEIDEMLAEPEDDLIDIWSITDDERQMIIGNDKKSRDESDYSVEYDDSMIDNIHQFLSIENDCGDSSEADNMPNNLTDNLQNRIGTLKNSIDNAAADLSSVDINDVLQREIANIQKSVETIQNIMNDKTNSVIQCTNCNKIKVVKL